MIYIENATFYKLSESKVVDARSKIQLIEKLLSQETLFIHNQFNLIFFKDSIKDKQTQYLYHTEHQIK